MIKLETSKRSGIKNEQLSDISTFELNWAKKLEKEFPNAIKRSDVSSLYNCHGLTFASRRTRIYDPKEIQKIIVDDNYIEIPQNQAVAGDIVLYLSENGDANHSGVVIESHPNDLNTKVFSKWGNGAEFIHGVHDCPGMYGPVKKFYRCKL